MKASFSEDPARVLREAGPFLESEPALHNVLLTLLHARAAGGEAGRYWVVQAGERVAGVVLHSPLHFPVTFTPMEPAAVVAAVEALAVAGVAIPAAQGEAATAARFAGEWSERRSCSAVPTQGQRLYEQVERVAPRSVPGALRRATAADRDRVIDWLRAFQEEIGEPESDASGYADRQLPAGRLWLWDHGEPRSMVAYSAPVAGVARVQAVYTPPDERARGWASASVAALSAQLQDAGLRRILYTDLGNVTSNSVYRRIGYRAVAELLRYRFS